MNHLEFMNNARIPGDGTLGKKPRIQVTDIDAVSIPDEKHEKDGEYIADTKSLRKLLKLYLYSAFKLQGSTCSIHPVNFAFLLVQTIKIILISSQMFDFGYDRGNFSEAVNRGHLTLRHLLLEGWDASWETLAYPPAQGEFAVYTIDDLKSGINFAVKGYYNAEEEAIGYFNRTKNDTMEIQVKYFDFPGFRDADVSEGVLVKDKTFPVDKGLTKQNLVYDYDVNKEFEAQQLKQPIKRMLSTELRFSIHSVRVYEKVRLARCLNVKGWVTFNDLDNNGQVSVNLETLTSRIKCERMNLTLKDWALENTSEELGAALIVFCILSLMSSTYSIVLAVYIFWKTKGYMKKYYKRYYLPMDDDETDLPVSEYLRFINFWDIVVICSDVLTLYGTVWIVFENEQSEWIVETLDSYTVWLGVGCILAWISLLRFFKFHNKVHLLFSTLYRAFWNVMAYLLCVLVLFIGFWVGGFVVLSPYHVKFRTPESAAETLFAMVNGDEIYATIAILENEKTGGDWVWWFSKFYIGAYIAIFTVVVINLLIAIYMSAYESIRSYYHESPDERDLGPMEKALRRYLSEQKSSNNPIRASICHLLTDNRKFSQVEETLRKEMQKLVRVSERDVILIKPRTLKAFMEGEKQRTTTVKCGCFHISFLSFFGTGK
ncbi:mucolipin-3-like [Mercenaria mercenaria]|uniref:mucolipin-3-like n=1 Tax=Mercenaria mercenaria TaxID=6596 RepID=UPI00234F3034|nr:mucolipin-3-like [Mercenaria mercenaria]